MIYKLNVETVYCIGDVHGALRGVAGHIKRYDLHDCALIFCGDIGFGFEKDEYYEQVYRKLRPLLSKQNIYLFFLRGNHDNPSFFDDKRIAHKRFTAVSDYSVIQSFALEDVEKTTPTHSVLCVGGAPSVDRSLRKQEMQKLAHQYKRFHACDMEHALTHCKQLYWANETPIFDESSLQKLHGQGIHIDAVCTHTCPSFCEPTRKDDIAHFVAIDPTLEQDVNAERDTMDKLYERLIQDGHSLRYWYYGHFHYHSSAYFDNTYFCMIDMERDGIYDMMEVR